jgi:hypothetical protein
MYTLFSPKTWRFERKFFIPNLDRHQVEFIIKQHPAMFKEIYHQRVVNNIYLDTVAKMNYLHNVIGTSQRIKVRIRWYGDLFGNIDKPVLEIKIKSGHLGSKKSYLLDAFSIDQNISAKLVRTQFAISSIIPQTLKEYLVCLDLSTLNRYTRQYFLSADNNYRLTLDRDMTFYHIRPNINTFRFKSKDFSNVILELKYDCEHDDCAQWITNQFPFRMTKSSKYVTGLDRLKFF